MECKVGDRVKMMPFLDACRMGVVRYQRGLLGTKVEYPDGMLYLTSDLKSMCGRTVKVIAVGIGAAGVVYDITWIDGRSRMVFRVRPYLIESKVLSIEKCEVVDLDRKTIKFRAKVLEEKNRKEKNKEILNRLKKGKKK